MFEFSQYLPSYLVPLYLIVFIAIGAAGLEMLALRKDFAGVRDIIRKLRPNLADAEVERYNLLFVIVFGTIVSAAFVQPQTEAQAISAGLGWVGLVNTAAHPSTKKEG